MKLHDASAHVLKQKEKFDQWLESDDMLTVANAIIILCFRVTKMVYHLMNRDLQDFATRGGFTENMTETRLEAKKAVTDAPQCPLCGEKMVKRVAQKGVNSGNEFWSCANYPNCRGTRPLNYKTS